MWTLHRIWLSCLPGLPRLGQLLSLCVFHNLVVNEEYKLIFCGLSQFPFV